MNDFIIRSVFIFSHYLYDNAIKILYFFRIKKLFNQIMHLLSIYSEKKSSYAYAVMKF